jgi:signal transduction histidine kinase/ActR/RegA family two-component response regulator
LASDEDFREIAHARVRERSTRMLAAGVTTAVAYALNPTLWPIAWFAAVSVAQIPDAYAFKPFLAPGAELTAARRWRCALAAGLSTSIYSSIAGYFWLTGGLAGKVVIAMMLATSLMHVGMNLHRDRLVLGTTITPFLIHWFGLPLLPQSGLQPTEVIAIELAGLLYVVHIGMHLRKSWAATEVLRAARDEADAANHAKSRLLANISHEIRTPLNGMLGMAQAMTGEPLPAAQAERLTVLRHSGEALLTILNDVLDLSKMEAGKLTVESLDFDLAEVIAASERAYAPIAAAKGLSLSLHVSAEALGAFQGDPHRVRQIADNLISNAIKFTAQGSVRIEVCRADGLVELSVADTGQGLSQAQLDSLFQRYTQADPSQPRTHGGTGLGLSICRELARLMGGDVHAISTPGEGSTFTLSLPLARAQSEPAAAPEAEKPSPEAAVAPRVRVLAADDNPTNRLVLHTLLHQAGIESLIVDDGVQALEAWRRSEWDVILLDIQMPDLDGPGAARAIRAEEVRSGRPRTPIIAVTANVMTHQVGDYLAAGMDACVAKPIDVERLYGAIFEALGLAPAA